MSAQKIGILLPLTLGLLSAFGPFVTDFYLPGLPEMAEYFKCPPSLVQMSLTMGMLGLAAGQIFLGPLSDKYGRKPLLTISLLLFIVSSMCCVFATRIELFNLCRLFQGLGGAGAIVLSKSISTDLFTGRDLARFMAVIAGINGVSPVLAPVVGGIVLSFTRWQGIFVCLLVVGVVILLLSAFLKESLPPQRRQQRSLAHSYGNLFKVFRNPVYVYNMLALMFSAFVFFAYIASSPFVLQEMYGLSPLAYGLCFAINAVGVGVGAVMLPLFKKPQHCLYLGAAMLVLFSVATSLVLHFHLNVYVLMVTYFFLVLGFGLIQTPTTTLAMDSERDNAGSASAILGSMMFLAGGLASPLVSLGDMLVSVGIVMTTGAVMTLLMAFLLSRQKLS